MSQLSIFEAITLGAVQGITEWLPISSEGILHLVSLDVFGKEFSESFEIALWLHLGTFFAALVYFRKDIIKLISLFPSYIISRGRDDSEEARLTSFLIISFISTGVVAIPLFLFVSYISLSVSLLTLLIGLFLILTGLFQKFVPRKSLRSLKDVRASDGVLVGILQGFAIIPGISRSGITISALLARSFNERDALRMSFLMSLPVVLGGEVVLILKEGIGFINTASVLALVFSFGFGLLTIKYLLLFAEKISFWKFAVALGTLTVVVSLFLRVS